MPPPLVVLEVPLLEVLSDLRLLVGRQAVDARVSRTTAKRGSQAAPDFSPRIDFKFSPKP